MMTYKQWLKISIELGANASNADQILKCSNIIHKVIHKWMQNVKFEAMSGTFSTCSRNLTYMHAFQHSLMLHSSMVNFEEVVYLCQVFKVDYSTVTRQLEILVAHYIKLQEQVTSFIQKVLWWMKYDQWHATCQNKQLT